MNVRRHSWLAGVPLVLALAMTGPAALAQQSRSAPGGRGDQAPPGEESFGDPDGKRGPDGHGGPGGHEGPRGRFGPGGWGRGGEGRWMHGLEWMLLRGEGPLAQRLNLSAAQRQKLQEIGDRVMRQAIRRRSDIELGELDLANLLRSENPDEVRVDRQVDELARLRAEQVKAALRARLEARKILTRQQREKLRDWMPAGPPRLMGGSSKEKERNP